MNLFLSNGVLNLQTAAIVARHVYLHDTPITHSREIRTIDFFSCKNHTTDKNLESRFYVTDRGGIKIAIITCVPSIIIYHYFIVQERTSTRLRVLRFTTRVWLIRGVIRIHTHTGTHSSLTRTQDSHVRRSTAGWLHFLPAWSFVSAQEIPNARCIRDSKRWFDNNLLRTKKIIVRIFLHC